MTREQCALSSGRLYCIAEPHFNALMYQQLPDKIASRNDHFYHATSQQHLTQCLHISISKGTHDELLLFINSYICLERAFEFNILTFVNRSMLKYIIEFCTLKMNNMNEITPSHAYC